MPRNIRIRDEVEGCLAVAGHHATAEAVGRLCSYFALLMEWNQRVNLTGFRDPAAAVRKHLGDTLTLLPHLPSCNFSFLDIGTGAGVPGLLLKILRPGADAWLVDAVRKKVSFLCYAVATLGLTGVHSLHVRLQEGARPPGLPEEGVDVVVSQAMTSVTQLVRLSAGLLAEGGRIIAMKGRYAEDDRRRDLVLMKEFGMEIRIVHPKNVSAGKERSLVIVSRR